jgi:hypothetical protein
MLTETPAEQPKQLVTSDETTAQHFLLNAPESLTAVIPQSVPAVPAAVDGQETTGAPAGLTCDLAQSKAFCEDFFTSHVPVLAAFGGKRLHMCRVYGSWDLERVVEENAGSLFRSIRRLSDDAWLLQIHHCLPRIVSRLERVMPPKLRQTGGL